MGNGYAPQKGVTTQSQHPIGGKALREATFVHKMAPAPVDEHHNTTDNEIQRPPTPGFPEKIDSRPGAADLASAEHGTMR